MKTKTPKHSPFFVRPTTEGQWAMRQNHGKWVMCKVRYWPTSRLLGRLKWSAQPNGYMIPMPLKDFLVAGGFEWAGPLTKLP